MATAGEKRVKWASVPDADFETLVDDEIAARYGCTSMAATTERKKRRKQGRVVNGVLAIRASRAAHKAQNATPQTIVDGYHLPPREDDQNDKTDPLRIFKHEAWGEVRTVKIDGEVWFVGKDVCEILGYTNPPQAISDHVEKNDTLVYRIDIPSGAFRGMTLINTTGVITLISRSKMPDARKFQRWLFGEVVPALMREGTYTLTPQALMPMTPQDEVHILLAQNDRLSNFIRAQHAQKLEMDRVIALQAGEIAEKDGIIAERTSQRDLYRDMVERVEEPQHANYFAKRFHKNGIHLSARALNKILVDNRIGAMKKIGGQKRFEPFIEYVDRGWYITHQFEYRPGRFSDIYELTNLGRQAITELLMGLGYRIQGSPSDRYRTYELF